MGEQVKKEYASKKALYLLLCGLLGIILFVIVQQAALLLLILLLANQVGNIESGLQAQVAMFDSLTYMLAMFFGAWYGIWLGLHWYTIVYEQGRRGLFHAFVGKLAGTTNTDAPEAKTPIMARPLPAAPKQAVKPEQSTRKTHWGFEDLASLRPVTPRPSRAQLTADDSVWSKKVSVKPSAPKRTAKKTAVVEESKSSSKRVVVKPAVRRKVTAKTIIKESQSL